MVKNRHQDTKAQRRTKGFGIIKLLVSSCLSGKNEGYNGKKSV